MALVTLQEYKDFVGLSNNPAQDTKINILIEAVSALIQAYTGKSFDNGGTIVEETISIDYDTNAIYLDNYPIASVISISETSRYTYDSSIHVPLTYNSDYTIDYEDGIIYRQYVVGGFASWPVSPGNIIIKYVTGDNTVPGGASAIPSDLKLACFELITYYKDGEYRQSKTIQSTSLVNTLAQGTDFPKHIQVILDRYKQV